jgi:spore coat polysaccharide biosynthesis protein SpsF
MDSTRLAGKVLRPLSGRPLLGFILERLAELGSRLPLVLATTARPVDDPIDRFATAAAIGCFRHPGPVDDVAARVLACAEEHQATHLVRLNGDSPFVDPALVRAGLEAAAIPGVELVTNIVGRTFPYGISVEVVRVETVAAALAAEPGGSGREHWLEPIYRALDRFQVRTLTSPRPQLARARLVIDDAADLERCERLLLELGPRATQAGWQELAATYLRLAGSAAEPRQPAEARR